MLVPYSWLGEIVGSLPDVVSLAELLLTAGLEVEETQELPVTFSGVSSARILDLETHAKDSHLQVATLDAGSFGRFRVMSAAANLGVGLIVPLALPGAQLPSKAITTRDFAGISSQGMLCSREELGLPKELLPTGEGGIAILPEGTPLGQDLNQLLGFPDNVLNVKVTANRPDWLSMVGLGREVAIFLDTALVALPEFAHREDSQPAERWIDVRIENDGLCSRYLATVVRDLHVGPSPLWLASRLWKCGLRPISNVVDATNYVMLEIGQPLHAFNAAQVAEGKIVVRQAGQGEAIITLDGIGRSLEPGMLLISDPRKPLGIAGVMGGLESEVTSKTEVLVLEAARFLPASIRKTARRLGLKTEASQRFERGVTLDLVERGSQRATALLTHLSGGSALRGVVDRGEKAEERHLRVRPQKFEEILALPLDAVELHRELGRLGFQGKTEEDWEVRIPTWRQDVREEVDLVEDIARLIGYDKIPSRLLAGNLRLGQEPAWRRSWHKWRAVLLGFGLQEVFTDPLVSPRWLGLTFLHSGETPVRLLNPSSPERSVLRQSMIPSLLQVLATNQHRGNPFFGCCELGKTYHFQGSEFLPREPRILVLAALEQPLMDWQGHTQQLDFFRLKGWIESLFPEEHLLLVPIPYDNSLHPGRSAALYQGEKLIGVIGEVRAEVQRQFELRSRVLVAEIEIELLLTSITHNFTPYSRYPVMQRDLALVMPEEMPYAEVEGILQAEGGPFLEKVELFDLYQGDKLPPGQKGLAFSLQFRNQTRTLMESQVNDALERIERSLESKGIFLRTQ